MRQERILDEQRQEISTYGVDPATGKIVIPIDKAIELLVSESAKESSNVSNEKNGSDET
jgi:hypothetical protein